MITYNELMLPLLKACGEGLERSQQELVKQLADELKVSEEERTRLLPSGRQRMFDNRIGWARTYLKAAGLLESSRRGVVRITERGRELLKSSPSVLCNKDLERYPEFLLFKQGESSKKELIEEKEPLQRPLAAYSLETPQEMLERSYATLRHATGEELLKRIKEGTPEFFEKLILQLMRKMGYGGAAEEDQSQHLGRSNDEGVDGVIKEDRLGFGEIYLQAKKWEGSIGRPEIQRFVGALAGKKSSKGVFITTSTFTTEAKRFVESINYKIVLIDGPQLIEYMLLFGLGVRVEQSYEIHKVDFDFFEE